MQKGESGPQIYTEDFLRECWHRNGRTFLRMFGLLIEALGVT